MVTSIILINTERTRINEVAEQIAGLVTKELPGIDSIVKIETILAFKRIRTCLTENLTYA